MKVRGLRVDAVIELASSKLREEKVREGRRVRFDVVIKLASSVLRERKIREGRRFEI